MALDSEPSVEPPSLLGLHRFYTKYLDSDGIPIVSGSAVPDEALYAARVIFGEMLAARPDPSSTMAELGVRVVIMARSTVRSDLPEFPADSFWDARTRGGGFFHDPMVVFAERRTYWATDLAVAGNHGEQRVGVDGFRRCLHDQSTGRFVQDRCVCRSGGNPR